MKKLYQKSEIWFSVAWIAAYCVLASLADNLSAELGIEKVITLPVLLFLSALALAFVKNNGLLERYGICKARLSARKMLFYAPLFILITANMWNGLAINLSPIESALYILSMLFVGFLEEIIFRGFLFGAMLKDSPKAAIIVSSVTFGIGHIINLINGSGAELIPNLLQVVYAIAAGFMFVMIYYKGKSLIPCIITHGVFNALSVFANEVMTLEYRIISCALITVISSAYAIYLALLRTEEENI